MDKKKDILKDEDSRYSPIANNSRGAERFLSGMASMVQVVGVIFGIVIFIWGVVMTEDKRDALGMGLIILSIPVMLTSIAMGAMLRVISKISNTLHDIHEKMK